MPQVRRSGYLGKDAVGIATECDRLIEPIVTYCAR